MSKKVIIPLILITLLLVGSITLAFSYAMWNVTKEQTNENIVESGCLNLEIQNEENAISLNNAYPITDSEASRLVPYTFTIKNTCNIYSNYMVNIEALNGSDMESRFIATSLNNKDKKILSSLKAANKVENTSVESRKLVEGGLAPNEVVTYNLRLWMDESVKLEDNAQSKTFNGKIIVIGSASGGENTYENQQVREIKEIIKKAEQYYKGNNIETLTTIEIQDSNNILNVANTGIEGTIYIKSDGRIAFQGLNNNKCMVKRYDREDIEILDNNNDICDKPIYRNLVINGYGEYGDNTNSPYFRYNVNTNSFELSISSYTYINIINDYILIDSNKNYNYMIEAKANNDTYNYVGFLEYDIDKKLIDAINIMYIPNTLTRLTEDLKPGDTVVHLENLTNWKATSSTPSYQLGFIFWNYKDSTGYEYPPLSYSRNVYNSLYSYTNVDKTSNTITLKQKWNGPTVSAGTQLSQSNSGASFNYCLREYGTIAQDYTVYRKKITGNSYNNTSNLSFRIGTKYILPAARLNYTSISNIEYSFKNIVFEEVE